jgi:hypothetical protein
VGGIFTAAGGKPSAGIARWVERPRLHFGTSPRGLQVPGQFPLEGEPGLDWRWESSADLQHWFPLDNEENGNRPQKTPARFFRGALRP